MKKPVTYKGITYESINALARAVGLGESTVRQRIRLGTDPGREPLKRGKRKITVDDIEYPSVTAAARALGVNTKTAHGRLRRGIPINRRHGNERRTV